MMRIAALIAYGLICIPGFMIGLPLAVHLLLWPFEESSWFVKLMLFLADLAIIAAIVVHYKKQFRIRKLLTWVAFITLCIPIVYVYFYTKGEVLKSPVFVLPSLGFIGLYILSVVRPSATASNVFQKDCCKET